MKKRWITVLELRDLNELQRIRKAQEIKNAMEENAMVFPDPVPSLADMQAQIDLTQEAYDDSRDSGKKATADYHTDLDSLERMMNSQANYVENVANDDPDNGKEIILCAAMDFKDNGEINIPLFQAQNAEIRGEVNARMKSQGQGTAYLWEYKEDGTADWIRAGTTTVARFTYTGLTPVTRYQLRGGWLKGDSKPRYFDPIGFTVE